MLIYSQTMIHIWRVCLETGNTDVYPKCILPINLRYAPIISRNASGLWQTKTMYVPSSVKSKKFYYVVVKGSGTLDPRLEPHQCLHLCMYVDRNGTAAMLDRQEVSNCRTRGESAFKQNIVFN